MRLFCLKNNLYLFFHRLPAEEDLIQDSNMDVTPSREVSHATSEGDSGVFDNCSSHDHQRLGVVMNRLQVPPLTLGQYPTMGLTQRVGLAAAIPSLSTSLSVSTLQQESRKMSLSLLTHLKVIFEFCCHWSLMNLKKEC